MSEYAHRIRIPFLAIGALGVVYGDIGTSPLYAVNEIFFGGGRLTPTPEHAAGIASLIIWMLITVVSFKYALLALRASHNSEGGTLALLQIVRAFPGAYVRPLSFLLMFATGLLLGDGIITPAISVLSAVEGLHVVSPSLGSAVVPLTLIILVIIFWLQRTGTERVGRVYGPVMLAWFVSIGILGALQIAAMPVVVWWAINPLRALVMITSLPLHSLFMVLGAALLAVTGAEALYADLGHFGARAIRVGWFYIVFPALALNYLGQAAYLAQGLPVEHGNIFYSMTPVAFQLPLVFLATAATIIASVALIFGMYSLTSQAIATNIFPRLRIVHTNARAEGQIYIPAVNWFLFAGSMLLVISFGSASRLAAAYGFAVSGVMVVTSLALLFVARHRWQWQLPLVVAVFGTLILYDSMFFAAASLKFYEGGWIPCLIGTFVFTVITTWEWGRRLTHAAYDAYVADRPVRKLIELKRRLTAGGGKICDARVRDLVEMDRAVVFFISHAIESADDTMPVKMRVFLKRRGAIPRNVLFLNVEQTHRPYESDHYDVHDLGEGVFTAKARFGYMERPDAAHVIRRIASLGVFDQKYRRCAIEVSEDELIVDNDLPFFRRMAARFYQRLVQWSVPRYRYFGLSGHASGGMSKAYVPLRISRAGVRVEIPEFPLAEHEHELDPDTLETNDASFVRV